ncbi:FXYD domain-containing ion transport regulator 3-like [Ranitomeya variabilis]|uniref:FXYD domain-containing ion transport regulator 3-like n=1 Tax=Ranitomeya variabilis TaxID=490064 RepID=UPI004057650B
MRGAGRRQGGAAAGLVHTCTGRRCLSLELLLGHRCCHLRSSPPRVESPDLKMPDVCVALFLMLASAPLLLATSGAEPPERNPFEYDYKSLQIAGLIMAGVLCAMGIIILISGKCRCKFNQKEQMRRSQDPQLITPGSASRC